MSVITATNNQFIGIFLVGNTSPLVISCGSDSIFTSSGSYADCCPSSNAALGGGGCEFGTACVSNSLIPALPSATHTCGTDQVCAIQTIFGPQSTLTKPLCAPPGYSRLSLLQAYTVPVTSTLSTQAASSTLSSGPTASVSTATLTDSTSSSSSSPSASTSSSPDPATNTSSPNHNESSKAWIAGAVVAPLVVLAIVGCLVFYIYKLRRRTDQAAHTSQSTPSVEQKHAFGAQLQQDPQAQMQYGSPQPPPQQQHLSGEYGQFYQDHDQRGGGLSQGYAPVTSPPVGEEERRHYELPAGSHER